MIDNIIKLFFVVWITVIVFAIAYSINREDKYKQEKEKIEYISDLAITKNRLELQLDLMYIDSLKQEIDKQ